MKRRVAGGVAQQWVCAIRQEQLHGLVARAFRCTTPFQAAQRSSHHMQRCLPRHRQFAFVSATNFVNLGQRLRRGEVRTYAEVQKTLYHLEVPVDKGLVDGCTAEIVRPAEVNPVDLSQSVQADNLSFGTCDSDARFASAVGRHRARASPQQRRDHRHAPSGTGKAQRGLTNGSASGVDAWEQLTHEPQATPRIVRTDRPHQFRTHWLCVVRLDGRSRSFLRPSRTTFRGLWLLARANSASGTHCCCRRDSRESRRRSTGADAQSATN
mmetsp:Transcript_82442/g.229765  ORF Transcript_82442/g.229765 Transcript_82442/m.229765 type:complete len:268 (+) Transcript_82442:267-1070(+)